MPGPSKSLTFDEKKVVGRFAWIVAAVMAFCAWYEPNLSVAFWLSLGVCMIATFCAVWITIGRWQTLRQPEYAQDSLTFEDFARVNRLREAYFEASQDWVLGQWSNAMAGECGEACNVVKKYERGDYVGREDEFRHDLTEELVGTLTYLFKVADKAKLDLAADVGPHWNAVSDRVSCPIKIPEFA